MIIAGWHWVLKSNCCRQDYPRSETDDTHPECTEIHDDNGHGLATHADNGLATHADNGLATHAGHRFRWPCDHKWHVMYRGDTLLGRNDTGCIDAQGALTQRVH